MELIADPAAPGNRDEELVGAPSRVPLPPAVVAVIWVLASIGGLSVWLLLYAYVLSGFAEASAQHALYATFRSDIAQGLGPLGGRTPLGKPVAMLRIPQAGVNDVVLEGTTSGVLEQGPGLEADTPLPGQAGVSVIYGRQALFGGPFRHLSVLRRGDILQVTTQAGSFNYQVIDLRYPGDPYPPPLQPGAGRLTLITTTSAGGHHGALDYEFLYVDSELLGKTVATPAGQPNAIPASQQPMHGDPSVMFVLVLWMQLLVIIVVAAVWAGSRWAAWPTWLVSAPAVLAVVWVVSEVAFQLLPNLI